jgi:hypothetical protein
MLSMLIWGLGIFLEALLLVRGLQSKMLRRFPLFYSYIFFVLTQELLRFSSFRWYNSHYRQVYWTTQFLGLLIGSAIIFEIYRVGLRRFPGTAKMTSYLLFIVFGVVFARALVGLSGDFLAWFAGSAVELERNLRMVQASAILVLFALFILYAIPLGKNLGGILLGYSLFVGVSVVEYTVFYGSTDKQTLLYRYLQPVSYLLVLALWAVALWSVDAIWEAEQATLVEQDYRVLAASTHSQFQKTVSRLRWMVRS